VTLNLLVAMPDQIHMCCDFRLTDRFTGKLLDDKTQKLTSFSSAGLSALVAVSGVGNLDGQNIGEWVASKLGHLPSDSNLDDLLEMLKSAEQSLAPVPVAFRHHTFTVGAIVRGRTVVALVSNFQSLSRDSTLTIPEPTLSISMQRPTRIRVYAAGSGAASVQPEDLREIEALAKAGASQQQIQEKLKSINERAAGPQVSRGCYVASRLADGSGTARPYLTDEQTGDFILPETSELLTRMGIQLNPALDEHGNPQPIRMDTASYARFDMTAGFFKRELPKRPNDAELWNNYGVFLNNGGHLVEAEAAFRRAFELDPSSVPAGRNLAGMLSTRDATLIEARQIYEALLANDEVATDIRSEFAALLEQTGNLDLAEEEHAAASSAGDSVRAVARHATFAWQQRGNLSEAEQLFDRIDVSTVTNADTLLMVARLKWLVTRDADTAEDLFSRAISLNPKSIESLYDYGNFLISRRGDAASALTYYRRANKLLRKKSAPLESNEGLALLGVGGRPDRAIARFNRAIKLNPDLYAARVNLALGLYLSKQHQQASDELSRLRSLGDLPADVAIEADALSAVFDSNQDIRRSSREAVDAQIREGISLGSVFLDILKRHFRGGSQATIIRNWEDQLSTKGEH
jgi:Tfp pilus assembly protein PilF